MELTRQQKIQFIVESILHIEDANVPPGVFEDMTDDELDKEVEWYDYLWSK